MLHVCYIDCKRCHSIFKTMKLFTTWFLLGYCFLIFVTEAAAAADNVYDFVIVGAGTAGCVVAARLCQALPDYTFALLEQGAPRTEDQELIVQAARLSPELYAPNFVPGVTRLHPSEPNAALFDAEQGTLGRVQEFVEATTLGGSSNIAFQWETPIAGSIAAYGIEGLDDTTATPYISKIEAAVQPMPPPSDLTSEFAEETLEVYGDANFTVLSEQAAFPSQAQDSAYVNRLTVDDKGRRRSAYTAYLKPAMEGPCQKNLHLIQDATVVKLLFDHDKDDNMNTTNTTRTTGVQYIVSGDSDNVTELVALQEVVVTAGPFGTPRLLQLSGIGPADVLTDLGVDVWHDLPVGQTTFARPLGAVAAMYIGFPLVDADNSTIYLSPEEQEKFLAGEGGLLGRAISTILGKVDVDNNYHGGGFGSFSLPDQPVFTIGCFINPKSSGSLTITSNEFNTSFKFHTNLLSDPQDFASMVTCLERLNQVIPRFPAEYGMISIGPGELPMANWVSASTITSWHVVGGSAVGSVVDGTTFKVYGLENLRVVDASVLPVLSQGAGLLSSVYLVAEFFADKVIAEYVTTTATPSDAPTTRMPTASPTRDGPAPPTQTPDTEDPTESPVESSATLSLANKERFLVTLVVPTMLVMTTLQWF